jgi:hypothetical protein
MHEKKDIQCIVLMKEGSKGIRRWSGRGRSKLICTGEKYCSEQKI